MVLATDSWEKINEYVLDLQARVDSKIWDQLFENSITAYFIDKLKSENWGVCYEKDHYFLGSIRLPKKIITLRAELTPCQRDLTLFHELAHLTHPFLRNPTPLNGGPFGEESIEAIVEWFARKARANPKLLKHAVLSFGLEPYVYDQASYRAFNDLVPQLSFHFLDRYLLMD